MNTYFSSMRKIQKTLSVVALFALVISPFASIQFADATVKLNPVESANECPIGLTGFKIDETNNLAEGSYTFGNQSVEIYGVQIDGDNETTSFSFRNASPSEVMAVVVKGGPSANTQIYAYQPDGTTSDEDLETKDGIKAISHISFCYADESFIDPGIHVTKVTNIDTEEVFDFSASWNGGVAFSLGNWDLYESGDIGEGTYSVDEIDIPSGWTLASVECASNLTGPVADHTNISLVDGELVTCTFYNNFLDETDVVEPLVLTSMCTYADGGAQWRVRNLNNEFGVDFTWEIYDNQETGGPITATYGYSSDSVDTFFDSTLVGTMKIYWNDENGIEQSTTKAVSSGLCEEDEPEDATVTVYKETIPNGNQTEFDFYFGTSEVAFVELSDGENSGSRVVATGTQIVIHEGTVNDWSLTDVVCVDSDEQNVVASTSAHSVTIEALAEGDDVICTFTNTYDESSDGSEVGGSIGGGVNGDSEVNGTIGGAVGGSEVGGNLGGGVNNGSEVGGNIGGGVTDDSGVGGNIGGEVLGGSTGGSSSNRSGGGSSSSRPVCEAFELDGDTLSWETRRGYDLEITQNGREIYSTSNDNIVDEGEYELDAFPDVGDEFELTVNRGSREDTCTIGVSDGEVLGVADILGESLEIYPFGAPNTGAGGSSPVSALLFSALLALFGAGVVFREIRV